MAASTNESLNSTHDLSDAAIESQSVPKPLFYAKNMTLDAENDAVTLSTIRLLIAKGMTARPAKKLEMDMQALLRLKLREGANPCTPVLVYSSTEDAGRAEHAWGSCIGPDVDRVTAVLASRCGVQPLIAYPSILAMALDASDETVMDIIAEESKYPVSVNSMLLRAVGAPVQSLKPEPLQRPERVMLLKRLHQATVQQAQAALSSPSAETTQENDAHGNVLDELRTEDDAKPVLSTSSPAARQHASAGAGAGANAETEHSHTVPSTPWQAKPQAPPSEEDIHPVAVPHVPAEEPVVESRAQPAPPAAPETEPEPTAVPVPVQEVREETPAAASTTVNVAAETLAPALEQKKLEPEPIVATVSASAQPAAVPPPPVPTAPAAPVATETTLTSKRSLVVVPPLSLPQPPVTSTVRPQVQQPELSGSDSPASSTSTSAPPTAVSGAAASPPKAAISPEKAKPVITVPESPAQPTPVQSKPVASSPDKSVQRTAPVPSPASAPAPAHVSPQKEKDIVAARAQPQPIPETAPSNNKCCCVM